MLCTSGPSFVIAQVDSGNGAKFAYESTNLTSFTGTPNFESCAVNEAKERAKAHPGEEFLVFQLLSSHSYKEPVPVDGLTNRSFR